MGRVRSVNQLLNFLVSWLLIQIALGALLHAFAGAQCHEFAQSKKNRHQLSDSDVNVTS
jgi:hypothetical protein